MTCSAFCRIVGRASSATTLVIAEQALPLRKTQHKKQWKVFRQSTLETAKMRWIIGFAILMFLPSFCQAQGEWGGPLDDMPPEERAELMNAISQTCLEREVTTERHQRFWEIVDLNGWTKGDVQEVWDRVLGRTCVRQRYLALAVLGAFYQKNYAKSPEFKDYEDRLVRLGVLNEEEVRQSDEFLRKIAQGEPVAIVDLFGGAWQEKVFDEEWARTYRDTFEQLDQQYRLLLKLFDRNFKGYQ
jgi:hypothetical protein